MTHTEFEYALKKFKTPSDRVTCPNCGVKRSFVPYINTITGECLPDKYGRCNRQDSCGYHLNPYKDGYLTDREGAAKPITVIPTKPRIIVDLPRNLLIDSLPWREENTLAVYFKTLFPEETVKRIFDEYLIGNHNIYAGSVIFWFVNKAGGIRAGQIKQFDKAGHTVKSPDEDGKLRPRQTWIHKLIKEPCTWLKSYEDQELKQDCLFGEHLLKRYPNKPVAMFESPKTAAMASAYFPDYVCLAFGSLDNFTYDRAKVLSGKNVILYPDLSKTGSAFEKWKEKAERFKSITNFKISEILENNATEEERIKGLDMADFLERFDYSEVRKSTLESNVACHPKQVTCILKQGTTENQIVKEVGSGSDIKKTNILLPDNQAFHPQVQRSAENPAVLAEVQNNTQLQPKETYGWETETTAREDILTETAPEPTSKLFDIEEYKDWLKTVTIPNGYVNINNLVELHNLDWFIKGCLLHIAAFTDYRDPGNRTLFIRQLKFIRRHFDKISTIKPSKSI